MNNIIIACSTGMETNSAIGVIRISGFTDLNDFQDSFSVNLGPIEPKKAYFCKIIDNSVVLDSIVLTYFKGPQSYNGENILELSVHGNILNIERIINLFTEKYNIEYAKPGEFTQRALQNKKLTLAQVEGLDLFLNATTAYELSQGESLLGGELYELYSLLHKSYLRHKSALELGIDFLDDVGEEQFEEQKVASLKDLVAAILKLNDRVLNDIGNIKSPTVVISGKPNAGKSSLFNNLLKDNRAIVTNIKGTTRDYICENLKIENSFFKLTDTAGLRETQDIIEGEGVKKSLELIHSAFFNIQLISLTDEEDENPNADLIIYTMSDLHKSKVNSFSVNNNNWTKEYDSIIKSAIYDKFKSITSRNPILLPRHISVISAIYEYVDSYLKLSDNETDIAIISSELNIIGHSIEELIGIVSADDVLSNIFNNFCIGK